MSTRTPLADRLPDVATTDLDRQVMPRPAPGASASPSRRTGWSLSPGQRKLVVVVHIIVSVGLLGLSTALLVLGIVAAATSDLATSQAAYRSMGIFTRGVVQPTAVLTVVSGVILSLGTQWGLVRHYWIVAKIVLTVAAILCGMLIVGPHVQQAIEATSGSTPLTTPDLGTTQLVLIAATAANVLMLGAATFLSVYKPWGRLGR